MTLVSYGRRLFTCLLFTCYYLPLIFGWSLGYPELRPHFPAPLQFCVAMKPDSALGMDIGNVKCNFQKLTFKRGRLSSSTLLATWRIRYEVMAEAWVTILDCEEIFIMEQHDRGLGDWCHRTSYQPWTSSSLTISHVEKGNSCLISRSHFFWIFCHIYQCLILYLIQDEVRA